MPKILQIVVKARESRHVLSLTSRDVHLLDGQYFFRDGWVYRKAFGLDFIRGLKARPPLPTHKRFTLLLRMQALLVELETQRDLISFNWSYAFEDEPKRQRHGGAMSGFKVDGGEGYISIRPAGYCDLTISDVGPNGRGRIIDIVDMRARRQYETLDRGQLRVHSRKATVGWFDELAKLIAFLKQPISDTVQILESDDA